MDKHRYSTTECGRERPRLNSQEALCFGGPTCPSQLLTAPPPHCSRPQVRPQHRMQLACAVHARVSMSPLVLATQEGRRQQPPSKHRPNLMTTHHAAGFGAGGTSSGSSGSTTSSHLRCSSQALVSRLASVPQSAPQALRRAAGAAPLASAAAPLPDFAKVCAARARTSRSEALGAELAASASERLGVFPTGSVLSISAAVASSAAAQHFSTMAKRPALRTMSGREVQHGCFLSGPL